MILNEKIANLAQQALLGENQFLLETVVSSKHGPKKVTVIVDGDQGLTIDECAAISRRLLDLMEAEALLEEDGFTLEVTTPGVDRPLKLKREYSKNIGRSLRVQLKDKVVENGKLVEVSEESIALEQDAKDGKKNIKKVSVFPFSEIERAIVHVSFK
jgi:ribosome maturation factor RimP